MSIRDGLLVGDKTVSQYDGDRLDGPTLPLAATQSSQINAEFVYRGSTIAPSNRITLPASAKETKAADAVDDRVKAIQNERGRGPQACQDALGRHAGRELILTRS